MHCLRASFALALVVAASRRGIADEGQAADDPPTSNVESILQSHLDALQVSEPGAQDGATLTIARPALLKYNDPARRYLAGGVWRIGKSGRPKGLVALELWPADADPLRGKLHHELSSFEPGGLDATNSGGIAWHPRKSVLEFKPLGEAPRPASTAERRLLQMKELARGFVVEENYHQDVSVLRLLPRPIDRYQDRAAGIDDGAMFAFTYGTNPELVLLLECRGETWQFAVARLSWAELNVKPGGQAARVLPQITPAPNDAYTSQTVTVLLPQPR